MSGHIVMVTSGVMFDVRQSAAEEPRGWGYHGGLDSGHWTRSTT